MVYAFLVKDAGPKDRERIDGDLYAPLEGGSATDNLMRRVMES